MDLYKNIGAARAWQWLKDKFAGSRQDFNRVSWDNYFLGLAYLASTRSADSQTQHGSVAVNSQNQVISTGYNSFARGLPDEVMPNMRPDKYDHMIHSEENLIINKIGSLENSRVYITGHPCYRCLTRLWTAGVKQIYIPDHPDLAYSYYEKETDMIEAFIDWTGVEIIRLKPNLKHILTLAEKVRGLGFLEII